MILVGKAWDEMDDEHACCTKVIGSIRKGRKSFKVDKIAGCCGICDTTWVIQPSLFGDAICMAITVDGSPVRKGAVVRCEEGGEKR